MQKRLVDRADGDVAPESGLEGAALDPIRSAGLPEPVRQLDVGDAGGWVGRVDLAYPDRRLFVEIDSALHHSTLVDRSSGRNAGPSGCG